MTTKKKENSDTKIEEVVTEKEAILDKTNMKCFIITPIDKEGSDINRKAMGVLNSVIRLVLEDSGFKRENIKAASDIAEVGSINNQIMSSIYSADLIVANLTGLNANVMYELAIAQCLCKPIIHICEEGTLLPFDIKDLRTIFYINDLYGASELKQKFKKMLDSISFNEEYKDYPLFNSIKNIDVNEKIKSLDVGDTKTLVEHLIKEITIKNQERSLTSFYTTKNLTKNELFNAVNYIESMHDVKIFIDEELDFGWVLKIEAPNEIVLKKAINSLNEEEYKYDLPF
ncbi:hypothetical protein [Clostridium baratii]|uniref:hypothetical protein n=1 Tax=Clostridium baratii TaxID=1561 RepID=UPI0030D4A143